MFRETTIHFYFHKAPIFILLFHWATKCTGFVLCSCKLKVSPFHKAETATKMVSERCGLCDVQGLPLNQYPSVRPQFRDVPLSLKKGGKWRLHYSRFHVVLFISRTQHTTVWFILNYFTFSDCYFFVGLCNYVAISGRIPLKNTFNFPDCPFFKRKVTENSTCTRRIISCSDVDCRMTRLTGDHLWMLQFYSLEYLWSPCPFFPLELMDLNDYYFKKYIIEAGGAVLSNCKMNHRHIKTSRRNEYRWENMQYKCNISFCHMC